MYLSMVKTLSSQVNTEFLLGLRLSNWVLLVVVFFPRTTNGKQLRFSQNCKRVIEHMKVINIWVGVCLRDNKYYFFFYLSHIKKDLSIDRANFFIKSWEQWNHVPMKFEFKAYQACSCSLYLLKELQNKKVRKYLKQQAIINLD